MGYILDYLSGAFPFRELFPSRILEQLVNAETYRIRLAEKRFILELRMLNWFGLRPLILNSKNFSEIRNEIDAVRLELHSYGTRLRRIRARSGPRFHETLTEIGQGIDRAEVDHSRLTEAYDRLGEQFFSVERWTAFLAQCHFGFLQCNGSNPALDADTRREIAEMLKEDPRIDTPAYLRNMSRLVESVLSQTLEKTFYVEAVPILLDGTRNECRLLQSRIEWKQYDVDAQTFYCATGNLETVIALLDDVERTLKEEGCSRGVFKRIMSARERLSRGFGILADASMA
ncbi:MAG: hypothetical protein HGB37_00040 [Candidatus Moranbacteria bacterium]|nr:hypothetical protein [Candidatus Moranbacteria bacterium]